MRRGARGKGGREEKLGRGGGEGRAKRKGREAKRRGGKGSQSLYTSHHLPIARTCGKYW